MGSIEMGMRSSKGSIDSEEPLPHAHIGEGPPPSKKGGRKPGQVYVTSVRHAKKELIGIYNELKRGEVDPQVAQVQRAILSTWINAHNVNLEEEVVELRREMAAYRQLMRDRA